MIKAAYTAVVNSVFKDTNDGWCIKTRARSHLYATYTHLSNVPKINGVPATKGMIVQKDDIIS